MAAVAEMEVEAGPGAWNEGFMMEKACGSLSEGMARHEVRGNSMESPCA